MIRNTVRTMLLGAAVITMTATFAAAQMRTSKTFSGAKVNAGTASYAVKRRQGRADALE